MTLLRDRLFSTVALSHFAVDTLNGQRSVLFVYLAVLMGLSNTQLGLYSTLYILVAALLQPLLGYIADRTGSRWAIAGGTLWIGVFYTLGILAEGVLGLALIVVASLGSGAFHPAGTMQATLVGRSSYAGRETTSSSYFFLFGQAGLFFGPLAGGFLLQSQGPQGLLWLTAFVILVGILGFMRLDPARMYHGHEAENTGQPEKSYRPGVYTWVAFILLATCQSWVFQNMVLFLPKFLSDLGQTPQVYGVLSSTFVAGAAVGLLLGGILADRFGKRRVAAGMLTLAVVPLLLIPMVGFSPWLYVIVPLAGVFTGSIHSIVVVLAQRYIPGGMAMASGLILGFMFASGALGVLLSGYLADIWGLVNIFRMTAGLALVAAVMALTLEPS
ncbi:MAG: MFS transporter [Chloroflexi bacterium]|nr:MAG: MFS transporter [Chloroflexota bacterium]MBL1194453.1 MFS transporter [Chloroflexota bacterium]NOH11741.1 MFS transporter [Chloroflexota bacterium]